MLLHHKNKYNILKYIMISVPTGLLGTSTSKVQTNREGLKWGTSFLVYTDGVTLLGEKQLYICAIKKNTDSFLVISRELVLEVNNEKLGIYSCLVNRLREKMAA